MKVHISKFMGDNVRLWMGAFKSMSDTERGTGISIITTRCTSFFSLYLLASSLSGLSASSMMFSGVKWAHLSLLAIIFDMVLFPEHGGPTTTILGTIRENERKQHQIKFKG